MKKKILSLILGTVMMFICVGFISAEETDPLLHEKAEIIRKDLNVEEDSVLSLFPDEFFLEVYGEGYSYWNTDANGTLGVIRLPIYIEPTKEQLEKYLTYDQIKENIDEIRGWLINLEEPYELGDMDNDASVTINDIVYYFRLFANPQTKLTSLQFYQADIYQDGKINVVDAVVCVNKVIGKEE
jgi:hypothetical protein